MLSNSLLLKLLRLRVDEVLSKPRIAFLVSRGMVIGKQMSSKELSQFIADHERMLEAAKILPSRCGDDDAAATPASKLAHGAWLVTVAKERDRHDALRLLGTYGGIREFAWLTQEAEHPVYGNEATRPELAEWETSLHFCKASAQAMVDAVRTRGTQLSDIGHGILGYYEGALWMANSYPLDHFRSFGLASQTTN